MRTDPRAAIAAADTALGIEFGSTRIKAVLIGPDHEVLATGGHGWENCVACCASCNHRKADRLLSEIGWTLRTEPRAPQGRHWRLLSTLKEVDPMWSRYLDLDAA